MSVAPEQWDAERVRALRRRLSLTQQQLADALGVRQQTVSEWETGIYQPRGASARMLRVVAEHTSATYDAGNNSPQAADSEHDADTARHPQG
jgi:DNA-binding transcriptional regulator YiaG